LRLIALDNHKDAARGYRVKGVISLNAIKKIEEIVSKIGNGGMKRPFPKPNKGQCLEATGRLLQIYGILQARYSKVKAYYATAYNPYGIEKSTYKHSFVLNYMDVDNEVLLGKEFWDLVGGDETYEGILGIYQEVGRDKGPDMLDQLALGY